MDATIAAAVIAAAISAIGWLVNYSFTSREERNRRRFETREEQLRRSFEAQLSHVNKQLEQLYGPLFFLIHESDVSWSSLLEHFGRNHPFEAGRQMSEADMATWRFWVENDLMPRNAEIQSLLSTKSHLIEGPEMPQSYIDFIEHHNHWVVNHRRLKQEGASYPWRSKRNWPDLFGEEVKGTYKSLKRKQAELSGTLATSSSGVDSTAA